MSPESYQALDALVLGLKIGIQAAVFSVLVMLGLALFVFVGIKFK